jgi:hypothetical protein
MTIYNMINGSSMKSQIFVTISVAVVASVLVTGLASTIYAQSNMTGGMTSGGNTTGGNMTGGNMSTASPTGTGGNEGGNGDGDDDGNGNGEDEDGGEQGGEGDENN